MSPRAYGVDPGGQGPLLISRRVTGLVLLLKQKKMVRKRQGWQDRGGTQQGLPSARPSSFQPFLPSSTGHPLLTLRWPGAQLLPCASQGTSRREAPALSHLKQRGDLVKITPSMRPLYSYDSRYKEQESRAGSRGGKRSSYQVPSRDNQPGAHSAEPVPSRSLVQLHKQREGLPCTLLAPTARTK